MKFTLSKFFLFLVFMGIILFSLRPLEDPDFWWHIKTGQLILQDKQIPFFDAYSFTATGRPWIAHEWLAELFMFILYNTGGVILTTLAFSVFFLVAFFLTVLRIEDKSNLYAIGGALLLGGILSTPVLWPRPQIFTILYTSFFLVLLERYLKTGKLVTLIPLPVIMLLWVNQHGGFIVGLGVIGVFILGRLVDSLIRAIPQKSNRKEIIDKSLRTLIITLLTCTLVTLLNPNGIRILAYPFQTVNDASLQQFNQEWASPDFHERTWIPLAVMYLSLIGFGLKSNKPVSTTNILLVLVFGFMALSALKHVALFALVAIPVLADQISSVIPFTDQNRKNRFIRPFSLVVLLGAIYLFVNTLVHFDQKQEIVTRERFPVDAVNYMTENQINGRILNSYNWGGYMIWNLYPQYMVYIDGRCDMYGAEFVTHYVDIYYAKPGWQESLDEEMIEYVLVETGTYISAALQQSQDWHLLYEDEVSVLFGRN
jgi:hypothetical protein